jgi:hypothetical protein
MARLVLGLSNLYSVSAAAPAPSATAMASDPAMVMANFWIGGVSRQCERCAVAIGSMFEHAGAGTYRQASILRCSSEDLCKSESDDRGHRCRRHQQRHSSPLLSLSPCIFMQQDNMSRLHGWQVARLDVHLRYNAGQYPATSQDASTAVARLLGQTARTSCGVTSRSSCIQPSQKLELELQYRLTSLGHLSA